MKNNIEVLIKLIKNKTLRRLIKYGIIGFTSFLIDFVVTYYLKENLKLNQMLANTVGFCTGACYNFLFNKFWSFRSNNNIFREFVVFSMIALVGLGLNSLVILFFNGVFDVDFYVCKVIAVVAVFFWNFSMNSRFNFKSTEKFVALDDDELEA